MGVPFSKLGGGPLTHTIHPEVLHPLTARPCGGVACGSSLSERKAEDDEAVAKEPKSIGELCDLLIDKEASLLGISSSQALNRCSNFIEDTFSIYTSCTARVNTTRIVESRGKGCALSGCTTVYCNRHHL